MLFQLQIVRSVLLDVKVIMNGEYNTGTSIRAQKKITQNFSQGI
jgi:hypothetical protein